VHRLRARAVHGATSAGAPLADIRGKLVPELDRLIALARVEGFAPKWHVAALGVVAPGSTQATDASDIHALSSRHLSRGFTPCREFV
jgi:hypothetical protein